MIEHQIDRLNESNSNLVEIIRKEIEQSGPIRFDRFMELALHHPEQGYYRVDSPAPGRAGDFLTAPEAHPIFGATLAAQIADFDQFLDSPAPFTIVEYGSGSGRLIRPLLAELRQQRPELYTRIRYAPVEQNQARLSELAEHLAAGGHGDRLDLSGPHSGVVGCVIANEFIDAFSVRRITIKDGLLHEVYVDWQDGWFGEQLCTVDDPAVRGFLDRHEIDLHNGEQVEIHQGLDAWVRDLSHVLERGYALIIDYGYPADDLYQGHRRRGTLKAYFQHGASDEFYRGIGRQDLTAHVNFSEVIELASRYGIAVAGMTTQAEFLANLGIGERLNRLQQIPDLPADDYLAVRAAVLRMIDPGAMGRFRVVILNRGVERGHIPVGLKDMSQ